MDDSLFSTPDLSHIDWKEYAKMSFRYSHLKCRYEPDQDSFLFLDSLEKELSFIQQVRPSLLLEIGPGSGILSLIHI